MIRRLTRFRLRTLLLVVFAATVPLAIYAAAWRSRERQYALADDLRRLGVRCRSESTVASWGLRPAVEQVEIDEFLGLKSDGRTWEAVERGQGNRLGAETVRRLAEFPALRRLVVLGDVVEPAAIGEIARLSTLEELVIGHFPLDDKQLQLLDQLPRLRELTLEATQVTDDGVERLRDRLPQLQVYDD